jgi:hypothetical protein
MTYFNQTINLQLNDVIVATKAENELIFTTDRIEETLADTSIKQLQLKIKRSSPHGKSQAIIMTRNMSMKKEQKYLLPPIKKHALN